MLILHGPHFCRVTPHEPPFCFDDNTIRENEIRMVIVVNDIREFQRLIFKLNATILQVCGNGTFEPAFEISHEERRDEQLHL